MKNRQFYVGNWYEVGIKAWHITYEATSRKGDYLGGLWLALITIPFASLWIYPQLIQVVIGISKLNFEKKGTYQEMAKKK